MELNEYQSLAIRTAKLFETDIGGRENLIHAALGLGSEIGELAETIALASMQMPFDINNIAEEIGDGCWYGALMSYSMGWKFEDLFLEPAYMAEVCPPLAGAVVTSNPLAMVLLCTAFAGECLTLVKKQVIYGKAADEVMLKRYLSLYVSTLSMLSDLHSIDFCKVTLERNIAKLKLRFPDKYSDADALARADKASEDFNKGAALH